MQLFFEMNEISRVVVPADGDFSFYKDMCALNWFTNEEKNMSLLHNIS
jgi:hypothetical protein